MGATRGGTPSGRWTTLRELADYDRDRYLPDLAAAVSNLASCLAQLGERDEALTVSYEAVALYRELLETRPRPVPARRWPGR